MNTNTFVPHVYEAVDSLDPKRLLQHLTDDCLFVFGNIPGFVGRAAISDFIGAFVTMIAAMKHDIDEVWEADDTIISRMRVTYTRLDSSQVTYPAVVIWKMAGDQIREFRIYVDNSTLFKPN